MACGRCGSARLYQFEAAREVKSKPTDLPLVCRDCGLITVGGRAIDFPPELEEQAKSLAAASAEAGVAAAEELVADPGQRLEGFLAGLYRKGYLDGFFRALLFFRHNAKEGRLVRLRAIWKTAFRITETSDGSPVVIYMRPVEYAEFNKLLTLSVGDRHGSRAQDQGSSVPEGPPRM